MKTEYQIDGTTYNLLEGSNLKIVKSDRYNYIFDQITGKFARWGGEYTHNPLFSPIGPEILDVEITTICHGIPNKDGISTPCPFCYKSNTPNGINMSFETFKTIFDKLPKTLTQIAFGADSQATSNPDLWKIMKYCRENEVVPNITVANINDETANKLVTLCGAVAVSRYANKDVCYDSVKRLTDRGLTQTNIHQLVAEETYDQIMETLVDIKADKRLSKLNAIVLLSLKQKGRGTSYHKLSQDKFKAIVDYCMTHNINYGMDSCTANKFLTTIEDHPQYKTIEMYVEPCESGLFSWYINAEGCAFPCSFTEEFDDWKTGINMLEIGDFFKDVWYNERVEKWRNCLLKCNGKEKCRICPKFEI